MTSAASPRAFRVGTLTYTQATLLSMLFWMLWGDLFLQIMEAVIAALLPLQLKWLGASDAVVGLIKDSLAAVFALGLSPIVGIQSDRHRGKLGRRRPFLLWCTPGVVLCIILLGHSAALSDALCRVLGGVGGVSPAGIAITLTALFAAGFFAFNVYVIQVYQFLFADVIPLEVMGKFIGLYRAVYALGGFIFNRWMFGHAREHLALIYTVVGLCYGAAFLFLVWRVREGEYPPPPVTRGPGKIRAIVRDYAVECFTHPFYLKVYAITLCYWCATVPFLTFIVFFATTADGAGYAASLGLSLAAFGKIKAWSFAVQIPVFIAAGFLADRFHPWRVGLTGLVLTAIAHLAGFWLIQGVASFVVVWFALQVAMAGVLAAFAALTPRIFPRERYGQFCTANQVIVSAGLLLAPVACGWLLDRVRDYRFLYLWSGLFSVASAAFAVAAFRHWRRLGGEANYAPPRRAAATEVVIGVTVPG